MWKELKESSGFEKRRAEILREWNAKNPQSQWRGLAITPVKFGISFTLTHLNQAGALVLIYQDGTVQVNHGGTEMGQGVHTNIAMVAAKELGITLDKVRVMPTSTDKVPNTSATAASTGTDLNGMAVKNACDILRERLLPVPVAAKAAFGGPADARLRRNRSRFLRGIILFSHTDGGGIRRRAGRTVPWLASSKTWSWRLTCSASGFLRRVIIARRRSIMIARKAKENRSTISRSARR